MDDKNKPGRSRQRVLAAAIGGLMAATALPAFADSEVDALKQELAAQRKLIEQLMADRDAKAAAAATPAPAPAAAPAANAVTSTPAVRIYGIFDGGVEHISNVKDNIAVSGAATSKVGGVTRMPSITATLPSRVGIAGTKDVGGGYKGIAVAEIGFNTDDGTLGQGGRIFGRQLYAGIDTPYGAVTYGRQWSMLFHAMLGTDILGPNVYALGSMDGYLPSMRYDNSVAWRGTFGKFQAGVLYSFARADSGGLITPTSSGAPASGNCAGEVAGDANQCRGFSAMAKYDEADWGVAAAVDEQRGGLGAKAFFFNGTAPIAFTNSGDKDRRVNLGAYVKFGPLKVAGGVLDRKVSTTATSVSSTAYYLGAAYPITPKITLDGGVARMNNSDQDRDGTLFALRAFYNFDKGLDAYFQVGHMSNSTKAAYSLSVGSNVAPPAGGSQTGEMVGLRYMF